MLLKNLVSANLVSVNLVSRHLVIRDILNDGVFGVEICYACGICIENTLLCEYLVTEEVNEVTDQHIRVKSYVLFDLYVEFEPLQVNK